ncbi:MAG: translocation/assembly module TamB domain-containing protein [Sulfuricurvum sp.]|nr:translocation/assembly module TamB domain-containing protein [Sulfuricurvum sp.]MDD5386899.1 translocation/assembly module TamB domain-containing protein [Sulfuricurvum sp.]
MKMTPKKPYIKRLLRALKHLFVALHALTIMMILLASALFYIAFRPDGLELLNTTILTPLGIQYTSAEGSLAEGVTLHHLHSETIDAKTLTLDYNLTAILKGNHVVDSIRIDGLQVHLDDFISDNDTPNLPLPIFTLKEVTLTNLQLISAYPIELDIHGKNGSFDGKNLNFRTITASVKTRYASGALQGTLKNNAITGKGIVYPNASQLDPYLADFVTLPASHSIDILELSDSKVRLSTHFDTLNPNFDPKMSLSTITLGMDYRYKNNYLDFTALYTLIRDKNRMQTAQKLRYTLDGITTTTFEGTLLASVLPLPSKTLTGSFRDDAEGVAGKLSLAKTSLLLQSGDYEEFKWQLTTLHDTLNFLPILPEALQNSPLTASAQGNYHRKSNTLNGTFNAHHNHADINGTLLFHEDKFQLNGNMLLPPNAQTWQAWSMKPPPKLDFSLTYSTTQTYLSLNGEDFALSLQQHNEILQGSGNYLASFFDITGTQSDTASNITITSLTPSLNKTLTLIPSITLPDTGYYDAEIRTSTHIIYDTSLHLNTDVEIPWYAAVVDSKHQYSGTNSTLSLSYDANQILIDKYRLDIANHPITSDRKSYLHIDPSGNLIIDEIWIFDALHLDGIIDTHTFATGLNLKSDKFTYNGPEGDAHVALDLHFARDNNASQKLTGNVTFLDGKITYLPLQQFKVMDDDVIIVQDVSAPSKSDLAIEVKVGALKPLRYLTKELDIFLIPDLTLWKDPHNTMQILGMITFPNGTITTSGKKFTLHPSYLYFGGEIPLNPYLDITVNHEVDYKKIQMYITHRLDSPVFLFSSDPVMSQNDIMSYILFGASSNAALSSSSGSNVTARADATNFMLGAGLKGLIGGATKLQIDTMNILTTKEGGMGFEVGARLNKDFRVLYKNDTISSVLVQYTVNRWLRLDADIHELGQGINAIYIKDFRDFLPHNRVQKVKP